jgi:hypothetical protein
MSIIKEIEESISKRAKSRLDQIPTEIRKQLERIEKIIIFQFALGSHWNGNVQLMCFDQVLNSRMTLDELEVIIKTSGKKLADKMSFEKALKKITKVVERKKMKDALINKFNGNRRKK